MSPFRVFGVLIVGNKNDGGGMNLLIKTRCKRQIRKVIFFRTGFRSYLLVQNIQIFWRKNINNINNDDICFHRQDEKRTLVDHVL